MNDLELKSSATVIKPGRNKETDSLCSREDRACCEMGVGVERSYGIRET